MIFQRKEFQTVNLSIRESRYCDVVERAWALEPDGLGADPHCVITAKFLTLSGLQSVYPWSRGGTCLPELLRGLYEVGCILQAFNKCLSFLFCFVFKNIRAFKKSVQVGLAQRKMT